jgi:hypothetical protein
MFFPIIFKGVQTRFEGFNIFRLRFWLTLTL